MPHAQQSQPDYSRYFPLRQQAYLINLSETRDLEQFESLGGIIARISGDAVLFQTPYATGLEYPLSDTTPLTYKLTTAAMGGGVQILADLVGITDGNTFHLKLRGNMEFYQRRQAHRTDTSLRLFQIRQGHSLSVYRKECRRIMDQMKDQGLPPDLKLFEEPINLGAGGVRVTIDLSEPLYPLSIFFFDLADNAPPVCAVAELAWHRNESNMRVCGHRFVQIRKGDQVRLNRLVLALQKQRGIITPPMKANWELLDRMTFENRDKLQTG